MSTERAWIYASEYAEGEPSPLPGTVADAVAFMQWLVHERGLPPENIYACLHPVPADPVAGHVHDADLDGIYDSLEELIQSGRDQTTVLFGFYSGHGFEVESYRGTEAALVLHGYNGKASRNNLLRGLAELQYGLRKFVGGRHHLWFVDACRTPTRHVEVAHWALEFGQRATAGQPYKALLHSASPNQSARTDSHFVESVLSGLSGAGAAKEWRQGRNAVTFHSLTLYVAQLIQGQQIQPEVPVPDLDLAWWPAAEFNVELALHVDHADPGTRLRVELEPVEGGAGRVEQDFDAPDHRLSIPPGRYRIQVRFAGTPTRFAQRSPKPEQDGATTLLEDRQVSFTSPTMDGGLEAPHLPEALPVEVELPRVPRSGRLVFRDAERNVEFTAHRPGPFRIPAGTYEVRVPGSRFRAGLERVVLDAGAKAAVQLSERTEEHEALLEALGGHFSERLGTVHSEDLATWRLMVGVASVAVPPDGSHLTYMAPIPLDGRPGEAVLVIGPPRAFRVALGDGPWVEARWHQRVPLCFALLDASRGSHTLRFQGLGEAWAVGVWTLSRRITVVALAGEGPTLEVRQLAPVSWSARQEGGLTPMEEHHADWSEVAPISWRFGVIQDHIAQGSPLGEAPDDAAQVFEELVSGVRLDPLMTPLAGWAALGRGLRAGERDTILGALLDLEETTDAPTPDLRALRVALGAQQGASSPERPWLAEAMVGYKGDAAPELGWLDTTGPWILWWTARVAGQSTYTPPGDSAWAEQLNAEVWVSRAAAPELESLALPLPVRWAQGQESPDLAHLGEVELDTTPFELDVAALERLVDLNRFDPTRYDDQAVVFGLRGCRLVQGEQTGLVSSVTLAEDTPDHADYHCIIGVWRPQEGALCAFRASTVPNWRYTQAYMEGGPAANMLPTGCYRYVVGRHGSSLVIWGALRMAQKVLVRRVTRDYTEVCYRRTDRLTGPYRTPDNIHPGYYNHAEGVHFASAGCQTVPGSFGDGAHLGPWADFRALLGLPAQQDDSLDGHAYAYMLLTGREARLVATGQDQGLQRLRMGSRGDEVEALQQALGTGVDGIFGAGTAWALATWQASSDGPGFDAILTPDQAVVLGVHLQP